MVSVSSDALSLENGREAQVLWHLIFGDDIVSAFRLTDDELADLETLLACAFAFGEYLKSLPGAQCR